MKNILIIFTILATIVSCKPSFKPQTIKLPLTKKEYTLLKNGMGPKSKIGDYLRFGFEIKGNNGKVLADRRDSSMWEMDVVKQLDSTANPLVEMLYSLKQGDSASIKVPFPAVQKPAGMEGIDTLVYFVKLEKIMSAKAWESYQEFKNKETQKKIAELAPVFESVKTKTATLRDQYKSGQLAASLQKTENGAEYYVIEKGKGNQIKKEELVKVHYYGILMADGKSFDSSYPRGEEITFPAGLGQMIPGWDETMLHLNHGDKAIIFIPYKLGYGETGNPPVIPAKSDLAFYVDVK